MSNSWSKVDRAEMDIPQRGSQVRVVIADKVTCMTCGKECYSEFEHYICHNCWKNGNAAQAMAELQSIHVAKNQEIAALQERIAGLIENISHFETLETDCLNALQALSDYHEGDYEVLPEVKQARSVITRIRGEE